MLQSKMGVDYFTDESPVDNFSGGWQELACDEGIWQTYGRLEESVFFVKHKKEILSLLGESQYAQIELRQCGSNIYGIYNQYKERSSSSEAEYLYNDLERAVIFMYSGDSGKFALLRESLKRKRALFC